ncbi:MAG: FHA domain-containing protein [Bdellovibrionota bacterium]
MFSVRILSGPLAGQKIDIKTGRVLIGRGANCQVQIQSTGVSKEHCELHLFNDRVVIKDLGSSNGTYLNGVKIQTGILRPGDKFGVYDIVMELVPQSALKVTSPAGPTPSPPQFNGNAAYEQFPQMPPQGLQQVAPQAQMGMPTPQVADNFQAKIEYYIYDVMLPGVYKLAEVMPLKHVLALFVFLFIFAVTLLSTIPTMRVTQDSIFMESRRRALSIARTIAQTNQQAFLQGSYAALSTQSAEVEEGVKQAFIIQQADGMIVAPATRAGRSSDLPFVAHVRNENKSFAEMIDSKTLAASFPIGQYDPNTGEPAVKAHAIVLYDVGAMALDGGRLVSLFMQTFIIASALGVILFFFMYQLIENPIRLLNIQLDQALREKKEHLETSYQFPALEALASNMSSLLSRAFNPVQNSGGIDQGSREADMERVLYLFGEPAMILRANETILGANDKFAQIARTSAPLLKDQGINSIQDNSLQQNLDHLIRKAREMPHSVHRDQLEFSGLPCELKCSTFFENGTITFFVVSIMPLGGGSS